MKRVAVESSNLASVGYSAKLGVLEVEFKSGSIYQYQDVPEALARGLRRAKSKGRYLNQRIKGKYVATCIFKVATVPVTPEPDPDPTSGPAAAVARRCPTGEECEVAAATIQVGDFIGCRLRPSVCGLVQSIGKVFTLGASFREIKAFKVVLASGRLDTIYQPNAWRIA